MSGRDQPALTRGKVGGWDKRTPFFVYCDEFQRVVGESTASALSELRKFGVGLVMAHQFIDQIPKVALQAVLGNVGSKVMFRLGAPDADRAKEFFPDLSVADLTQLPNFQAYTSVLVDGVPSQPFTLFTEPPPVSRAEVDSRLRRKTQPGTPTRPAC